MNAVVHEIPVHVGQHLRDVDGRLWLVRELQPLARLNDDAQWFVARLDFWSPSGHAGSVVMSSHEFANLVKTAVPFSRRPPAAGL